MQLKTILNHIQPHQGFVYGSAKWRSQDPLPVIEIEIRPRKGSKIICSGCGNVRPGYDTRPTSREWQFIPFWGILVYFVYAMRRVNCPDCGIKVEQVPWATGKNRLVTTYAWFLAAWAKRMSWKDVSRSFHISWDSVFRSVKMAVAWGLKHRDLDGITAIGIDEIAWKKGKNKFMTLVYQIDAGRKRLLWIGKDRTKNTLCSFFDEFGKDRCAGLRFVCTDMWKPYLNIVAQYVQQGLNILDRFHIMKHMNEALDKVRNQEIKSLKAKGKEPVLSGSKWCLLKKPENLTENQEIKLKELLAMNLKSIRAYLLKEDFQFFWQYKSAAWAGKFLDAWCKRTMRSKIEPMKKVAKMLRSHRGLILNWFRAKDQIAMGAVEGLNNKAKTTSKKAYGFSSYEVAKMALYHTLGDLPEPTFTHRFY
jgi:transposase